MLEKFILLGALAIILLGFIGWYLYALNKEGKDSDN